MDGRLPAFAGATGWLNTEPLTPDALDGKVVAVDFWTFTCINWLRTLPCIRAWAKTYAAHGLVVIGVHTPEFSIEHDTDHVRRAAAAMSIDYPIAIDNDYAIWDAFSNRYWPALYIADAAGRIQHHQFGEGGEDESEHTIRRLLADAGDRGLPPAPPRVVAHSIELAADWQSLRSRETYLGLARSEGFASPERPAFGEPRVYTVPSRLRVDEWALGGSWTVTSEDAACDEPNGRIVCRFHARDLHLILAPAAQRASTRFRVLLDGRAPGDAHGADVDDEGHGVVDTPRLYQVIRQSGHITERQFEIEFLEPGASALCFTFG